MDRAAKAGSIDRRALLRVAAVFAPWWDGKPGGLHDITGISPLGTVFNLEN